MKHLKNLGTVLSKTEQKKINGGSNGCDIAPVGCPCIVPDNHPCLGGGTDGGGSTGFCFGYGGGFACNSPCPDGSLPLCA